MGAPRGTLWGVLFGLMVLPACSTLELSSDYTGPKPLNAKQASFYQTPPPEGPFKKTQDLPSHRRYRHTRHRIPSTVNLMGGHHIDIDWYQPTGEGKRPLILTLPILGGKNKVAHHFASVLAKSGFAAAVVHRQEAYKNTEDLNTLNQVFQQIVLDHRQALDHLVRQPGIDPDRVGLFGVSYGAVRGTLIAATDPRIKASVLGLAGGDLAHIFAHSTEKGIVKRRDKLAREHGMGAQQIADEIRRHFQHDPLKYAPHVDARRTLLILAAYDTVIPFQACGMKLREAMGGPKTLVIPSGHHSSIIFIPFIEGQTVHFFRSKLGQPAQSARK